MANSPNIYYAKPNEIVDGSKLPSNIWNIQGAGANTVQLSGTQGYIAGPGNNKIFGVTGQSTTYVNWQGSGAFSINLETGIVANNGFGGSDSISNIKNVHTGGGLTSTTIVGDSQNNQFWPLSDNCTITGGGGVDLIIFGAKDVTSSQYTLSVDTDKTGIATNKLTNKSVYFYGITTICFNDAVFNVSNLNKIQSYKASVLNSYYFSGSSVQVIVNTTNVNPGTSMNWWLNTSSPDINNNN